MLPRSSRNHLLLAVGAGLLALALGAALALAVLPEWRTGPLPDQRPFRARFREIVRETGLRPARRHSSLALTASDSGLQKTYAALGERAASWLIATRSGVRVKVFQPVRLPGDAGDQALAVDFSLDGRPLRAAWTESGTPLFGRTDEAKFQRLADTLGRLLLVPGESLGPGHGGQAVVGPPTWRAFDILGSSPPQEIAFQIAPPRAIFAERLPAQGGGERPEATAKLLSALLFFLPLALAALVIFLALLIRGRIDLVNGTALALIALASVSPTWFQGLESDWTVIFELLGGPLAKAPWIFFVWSAGESLLRAADPEFSTSLDTLRRGRLGPRAGRSLLLGFALGGGLAALTLAVYSLAVVLPGSSPAASSLPLPVFRDSGSPLMDGIWLASGAALITALAVRFLRGRGARWVLPAAALLGAYALAPLQLLPLPAEWGVNVLYAGALAWICRRFGLTTLLTAAVTSLLLPAAVYSGLHLDWLPGSFALTAMLAAGVLAAGWFGTSRAEAAESGGEPPPPFMRRLGEERRLRHEVDLLARMQLGLLPREMPQLEGYQVAARSVLASDAGGDLYDFLRDAAGQLWIAAGDVAGHGYSCAVAQAMVKAGLLSLVEPEETPAGVLRQLDRVLRSTSIDHSFTALGLIRLDPGSGDALFANAGNPYPLLAEFGRVTEVEAPGLPLGHGPVQPYADRTFRLRPGAALVLCSDGLFEALDRNGDAYGFERAREVLRAMGHRPAVEIVDALLNDCRRHLGAETAPDDVTVVVVKRG
jgi:serine phosphatase RsbU (regulator of sigma subunit)